MKHHIFVIRTSDGYWYSSHGKWNGSGCIQTLQARFPGTFFDTKEEASKKIDDIVRDFPNEGVNCAIVSISYTMREVYA